MLLETDRLILRDITILDAADIFEYAKNQNVGDGAGWKAHKNIEETKSVIEGVLKVDNLAIVYKENNKVIGTIGLSEKLDKIYELGYSLSEDYWHKGLMSEAVKALIDYAFLELNAYEIDAGVFLDNFRSEKLLLNVGFKYIGIHKKDYLNYDNRYKDCKRFRLLKTDYMEG
jgi:RimJ/RimL family protein N-acetyltransferase